jgi:hypothetical protein
VTVNDSRSGRNQTAQRTNPDSAHHSGTTLTDFVTLWPTPQARDHFPAHSPEYIAEKRAQGHGMKNLNDYIAHPQLYPTPSANSYGSNQGGAAGRTEPVRHSLQSMAKTGMWPTPTAVTNTGGAALCKWGGSGARAKLRTMVTPQELNGALNPMWVEWLMGFPLGWTDLEPSGTL